MEAEQGHPTSFLIDVMDIWGRFIPGLLVIGVFVSYGVDPFGLRELWELIGDSSVQSNSWIDRLFSRDPSIDPFALLVKLSLVGVVALLLGELPVSLTLGLRSYLFKLFSARVEKAIKASDPTTKKKIVSFFEGAYDGVLPKDDPRSTFHACKHALAVSAPAAYNLLRKYEARLNLYAGLLLPVLVGGVRLAQLSDWKFWGIATAVVVIFLAFGITGYSLKEIVVAEQAYYEISAKEPDAKKDDKEKDDKERAQIRPIDQEVVEEKRV